LQIFFNETANGDFWPPFFCSKDFFFKVINSADK